MSVTVVEREEMRLVGIRVVGRRSELSHRVPLAWLELVRRAGEIPRRVEPDVYYGVFREDDQRADDGDGVHTYWVAAEVEGFGEEVPGTTRLTLPARRYATAAVRGGAEEIESAYRALGRWIEEEGRAAEAGALGFERYDQRRQPVTPPYERFDYDVFKPLDG